ncbi:MAG: DUF4142 domain-containing protein [Planctomycetia bacterium]|nr:DUF4142 domain-containing protein [Planctomycetia bacterium]
MTKSHIGSKKLAVLAVLVAAAGSASYSIGQQAGTAPRNDAARAHNPDQHFDQNVAQCLILSNRNEVAAAKIAEKKGSDAEVKNFAQTMVKDHEQFTADLQKFAGAHSQPLGARADGAAPAKNPGTAPAAAPATAAAGQRAAGQPAAAPADHMHKFMKIREEIADQCRASVQRELDAKQGKAFDECFMGLQIAAHMQMVDELTVLERHVAADLKPVLNKGLKTAQKHLDDAKQVMKDINDSTRTADAKEAASK